MAANGSPFIDITYHDYRQLVVTGNEHVVDDAAVAGCARKLTTNNSHSTIPLTTWDFQSPITGPFSACRDRNRDFERDILTWIMLVS